MTAFHAPEPGSPESFDAHLGALQFLPSSYEFAFAELGRRILGMKRDSDTFTIPDANEAGAWAKAFSIYKSLLRRDSDEARRAVPMQKAFLDDQKAFSDYVRDRNQLLAMLASGEVDEHICGTHLDLVTDDVADPMDEANQRYGGRRVGWPQRAQNIASALSWWEALSSAEKRLIQTERVARRLKHSKERHYA